METTTQIKPKYTISETALTLTTLILFAGLLDIVTTLVGVYYTPFVEVNASFLIVGFPVGVFIWVAYFVFLILAIDLFIFKNQPIAKTKKELETLEMVKMFANFLTVLAYLIPLHNLVLILGGSFL